MSTNDGKEVEEALQLHDVVVAGGAIGLAMKK